MPSNPWVAVGWRKREEIAVELAPVFAKRGIELRPEGAKRVHPGGEPHRTQRRLVDRLRLPGHRHRPRTRLRRDPRARARTATPSRSATSITPSKAKRAVDALVKSGGPVVIGAVQGASCFGPAYEFAFILDTALRRAKVRDRVPMTFVTPEPYIGHLGLDGVGDTKGLLESAMREHHIKWITNAKVTKVEPGKMFVEEVDDGGRRQGDARTALRLLDDAAGLPRRRRRCAASRA